MHPTARYLRALLLPLERVWDSPPWAKALAGITIAIEFLVGSPFVIALGLLIVCSGADYLMGSTLAAMDGRRDPHIARAGLIGKGSAVALVLLVWIMEAGVWRIANNTGATLPPWIIGILSAALALFFALDELDSFAEHRERITGKPTPLIRPILNALRAAVERLVPSSRP